MQTDLYGPTDAGMMTSEKKDAKSVWESAESHHWMGWREMEQERSLYPIFVNKSGKRDMLKKHDRKYGRWKQKKESLRGLWVQYSSIQKDSSNLVKIQHGDIIVPV